MLNFVEDGDDLAPIALFVYKRPAHLRSVIDSLLSNTLACMSDLYIFSDYPKRLEDSAAVAEVRNFIGSITGFKSVKVIERKVNYGLAKSIISGVSELLLTHEKIIVLEDDLICSRYFLDYMNGALRIYQDDERVISINAYLPPLRDSVPETFFLLGTDCWGWATWRRGWAYFERDGSLLLRRLKERKLLHQFNLNGAFPFSKMLEDQVSGLNDSWAIRWHAAGFLAKKLTLYPCASLVNNIGNDGTGTHKLNSNDFTVELSNRQLAIGGIDVVESELGRAALMNYYNQLKPSFLVKIGKRLMKYLNG